MTVALPHSSDCIRGEEGTYCAGSAHLTARGEAFCCGATCLTLSSIERAAFGALILHTDPNPAMSRLTIDGGD
jgi:hypothetical protein